MTEKKSRYTRREAVGESGVVSYTLDAPDYFHNNQQVMTLSGYQDVEEEQPSGLTSQPKPKAKKPRRKPAKKKQPPTVEVDLDAVQEIVEKDLIRRGYKNPIPSDTE